MSEVARDAVTLAAPGLVFWSDEFSVIDERPMAESGDVEPESVSQLARIETVVFLQSVDFFAHCKAEEVLRIAAIAQEKSFAAGERIYNANDPADIFYSVVRGTVELDALGSEPTVVPPLGTFGQVDILRGRLHTRGATAQTDCLLLGIEADDFFDLLSNNVEIVKALFRHVIETLQQGQAS